jgi:5-(carboxyamino)imidazole ribonucleotide synthase
MNQIKLGVLGGGQLGRMLLTPCQQFDVHVTMMDPDPEAPCKELANSFVVGDIQDYDTVLNYGRQFDVLTIEIENVNVDALYQLQKEGVKVFPQPEALDIIKDKRKQKKFYIDKGIPTSEFVCIDSKEDIAKHKSFLPAFQKVATGGYDGGGVKAIKSEDDIQEALNGPGLLEKFVDFELELSVIVARNSDGQVRAFPTVEQVMNTTYNLVDCLLCPASISEEIDKKAQEIAKQVIEELNLVGLLAVELFLTKDGELLVNEVAPRPHNSGHATIQANHVSQFEQHLRAVLGFPLGNADMKVASAMVNVIGEEGYTGPAMYEGLNELMDIDGASLMLYGKKLTKPHRKMGHVTITDDNIDRLKEKVDLVK